MLNFCYNNENKTLSLACGCRNGVVVLNIFDANGGYILSFKKHAFVDRVFLAMLIYRKQSMLMQEYFQMLQYLLVKNSIEIIAGDFNNHLLKVSENKLEDIFTDHV